MALILALNPGNSHSPTLSRLARELHGCELIGAESCIVAIKAIKERVPDVILLPAKPARGEADLLAHLKTVPGGVLTLKLPPVETANPLGKARHNSRDAVGGGRLPSPGCTSFGTSCVGEARGCGHVAGPARGGSRSHQLDSQPTRTVGRRAAGRCATRACRAMDRRVSPSASSEQYEPYEPLESSESDDYSAIDDTANHNPPVRLADQTSAARAQPLSRS